MATSAKSALLAFMTFLLTIFAVLTVCCKLQLLAADQFLVLIYMELHQSGLQHLMSCCVYFECKMAAWHTSLDQLEIPDGAVAGLSA